MPNRIFKTTENSRSQNNKECGNYFFNPLLSQLKKTVIGEVLPTLKTANTLLSNVTLVLVPVSSEGYKYQLVVRGISTSQ